MFLADKYEREGERERDLTPTLEMAREPPAAPFNELNEAIDINKGSQLGCNHRAHALDVGNPNALTTLRRRRLAVENGFARINPNSPLLLTGSAAYCCTTHPCIPRHQQNQDHTSPWRSLHICSIWFLPLSTTIQEATAYIEVRWGFLKGNIKKIY